MALLLGVCFSMNTAINTSNSISRASTIARLSALILPSAHSDSKRAFSASNSARSEDLFTVAIGAGLPLGLDRHHRPQRRDALGHRQRGKVAKSDAHNLWERMQKHETSVLRFAKHPDVAFTNNRAERDLRMSKVKQKVSGCFRTRKYAQAYCRISSYLQSMANQGYNPLVAIQIALAGRAVDNMGE